MERQERLIPLRDIDAWRALTGQHMPAAEDLVERTCIVEGGGLTQQFSVWFIRYPPTSSVASSTKTTNPWVAAARGIASGERSTPAH